MKKHIALILASAVILSLFCFNLTSCSSEAIYSEGKGELNILCTTFAPFDFARSIGGDRVTVSILQDSGADLHNYTPTAATLEAIGNADVFIYIGGTSDHNWLPAALAAAGNDSLLTLCLMDVVEPVHAELENDWSHGHDSHSHENKGHGHEGHDHGADEHIWTSVKNAKNMVAAIKNALTQADEDGGDVYEKNANAYIQKLDVLDTQLEEIAHDIPIILFADRFPFVYLLHDYHIPYKAAFSGCSTEINAGFETQIELINYTRENSLTCIFVIDGGSKDIAQAISYETSCKIFTLNSMQSIGRTEIISGANYIDIMQNNINVLKEAYQ